MLPFLLAVLARSRKAIVGAAGSGAVAALALLDPRLGDVDTMFAMTIHKSQGSQADEIVVIVPPIESKLLTRELVYTAVTRPQRQLTLVGSMAAVEQAVATPARRTSGLRQRLHG